jgi:hypothetical protein
VKFKNTRYIV